jgi:hypothetical protein
MINICYSFFLYVKKFILLFELLTIEIIEIILKTINYMRLY